MGYSLGNYHTVAEENTVRQRMYPKYTALVVKQERTCVLVEERRVLCVFLSIWQRLIRVCKQRRKKSEKDELLGTPLETPLLLQRKQTTNRLGNDTTRTLTPGRLCSIPKLDHLLESSRERVQEREFKRVQERG
jgi:hypothetical protein